MHYILAKHLEIVLEPFESLDITFWIKRKNEEYGDLYENVVVTAQFVERSESIVPIEVSFIVHYATPKLKLVYEGNEEILKLMRSDFPVVRLKANKFGAYELKVGLEGMPKMEIGAESRGKLAALS